MSKDDRQISVPGNLFKPGTVCFARAKGNPFWPAVVTDDNPEQENAPVTKRKVEFFNELKEEAIVHVDDILEFIGNFHLANNTSMFPGSTMAGACAAASNHIRAQLVQFAPHPSRETGLSTVHSRLVSSRPVDSSVASRQNLGRKSKRLKTGLHAEESCLNQSVDNICDQFKALKTTVETEILHIKDMVSGLLEKLTKMGTEDKPIVDQVVQIQTSFNDLQSAIHERLGKDSGDGMSSSRLVLDMHEKIDKIYCHTESIRDVTLGPNAVMNKCFASFRTDLQKILDAKEALKKPAEISNEPQITGLIKTIGGLQKEIRKRNKIEKKGVTTAEFIEMKEKLEGHAKLMTEEMSTISEMHKKWILQLKTDLDRQEEECLEIQRSRDLLKTSWSELQIERERLEKVADIAVKRFVMRELPRRSHLKQDMLPKKSERMREIIGRDRTQSQGAQQTPVSGPMEETVLEEGNAIPSAKKRRRSPFRKSPDSARTRQKMPFTWTRRPSAKPPQSPYSRKRPSPFQPTKPKARMTVPPKPKGPPLSSLASTKAKSKNPSTITSEGTGEKQISTGRAVSETLVVEKKPAAPASSQETRTVIPTRNSEKASTAAIAQFRDPKAVQPSVSASSAVQAMIEKAKVVKEVSKSDMAKKNEPPALEPAASCVEDGETNKLNEATDARNTKPVKEMELGRGETADEPAITSTAGKTLNTGAVIAEAIAEIARPVEKTEPELRCTPALSSNGELQTEQPAKMSLEPPIHENVKPSSRGSDEAGTKQGVDSEET